MKLRELKGLGPKSEHSLHQIGIFTRSDLESIGPVRAFMKLKNECSEPPSLNFLYALVGALEDRHWGDIARSERDRLLMELEGYRELEAMLEAESTDTEI